MSRCTERADWAAPEALRAVNSIRGSGMVYNVPRLDLYRRYNKVSGRCTRSDMVEDEPGPDLR